MKELSLHILDLVQNSVQAKAKNIEIVITEDYSMNLFSISIKDDGTGMNKETMQQILDPFFTTKNKKTGLGIPLLKQHAELTGGNIEIESIKDSGTKVTATFGHSHFDRQPLGDLTGTLIGLIRSYPDLDIYYKHEIEKREFEFSTKEIKQELKGISIASSEIIEFIKEMIQSNLNDISKPSNQAN
jgi:hypothetical protein